MIVSSPFNLPLLFRFPSRRRSKIAPPMASSPQTTPKAIMAPLSGFLPDGLQFKSALPLTAGLPIISVAVTVHVVVIIVANPLFG
jgi:hypothetical protein